MIFLTFLFLIEIFLIFYQSRKAREACLWSILIWAFYLIILLEILSAFKAVSGLYLGLGWGVGILIATFILLLKPKPLKWKIDFVFLKSLGNIYKVMLIVILLIFSITLFTGFVSPPNNYDSMTYHMSRVAHWAQNQSLAHYPTVILRQLSMPPAAEYVILNFYILMGNDRLANFVQWLAMAASLVAITLIAKELGANTKTQILSAFIGATIPMGIMQATSTQTDYFAGLWILSFVFFVLSMQKYNIWGNVLAGGIVCGLAFLSKPTAYFFIFPFAVWMLFSLVRKAGFFKSVKYLTVFVLLIIVVNSGFYYRNIALFGSPIWTGSRETNQAFIARNFAANVGKYIANHFSSPFPAWNQGLENAVSSFATAMRVDLNDKRMSGFGNFKVRFYAPHEDIVGNPGHMILIFLCSILLFVKFRSKQYFRLYKYYFSTIGGFLILFIFIKYQPWLNRLTLPIFLLFSPFFGIVLNKYTAPKILVAILLALSIIAFPPLFMNITKPLIPPPLARRSKYSILNTPRQFFYFGGGKLETYESYKKIVKTIKEHAYHDIGVVNINNEYPLWVLLRAGGIKFRLEHILTNNISGSIKTDFAPSAIICFDYNPIKRELPIMYSYKKDMGRDNLGQRIVFYGK